MFPKMKSDILSHPMSFGASIWRSAKAKRRAEERHRWSELPLCSPVLWPFTLEPQMREWQRIHVGRAGRATLRLTNSRSPCQHRFRGFFAKGQAVPSPLKQRALPTESKDTEILALHREEITYQERSSVYPHQILWDRHPESETAESPAH